MTRRIKAPDGYRLYDTLTEKTYSEVVIDENSRDRFVLVPAEEEIIVVEERR